MSSGGIFKLIANVGLQDKLLMATDYLNHRLKIIAQRNKTVPTNTFEHNELLDLNESWIPDINSISKTHMIFINNSYKPFVASGFEYNKCQAKGVLNFGTDVVFTIPVFGDFVNDCVVNVKISKLATINPMDKVRYVSFLGHKLFTSVSFKINASPLDTYYSDDYNAFYEFHVPPHKKTGWMRNVGQEIPQEATLTSDPMNDMFKEFKYFGDGFQTFKQTHDAVELWIPILFWFKDIKNALPNLVIPYGQTNITIKLAPINDLVGFADYGGGGSFTPPTITTMDLYCNNIFLQPEITKIFMCKFGFSLIRVHGHHNSILSINEENILLSQLKWPTENMYIAFRPQINTQLSQYWHKTGTLTLNNIKVPAVAKNNSITSLVYGSNSSTSNSVVINYTSGPVLSTIDDTYNGYDLVITSGSGYSSNIINNRYIISSYIGSTQTAIINGTWKNGIPNATTTFDLFTPQLAINVAQYYKETPSIDTIQVKAYEITIYKETSESFYNSYLPYRFGTFMNTPEGRGWYMLNFNFLPGEHQPSGHINLSKAREFYIKYTSSTINKNNLANMVVLTDAINFLLVKNGTCVLRYTT